MGVIVGEACGLASPTKAFRTLRRGKSEAPGATPFKSSSIIRGRRTCNPQ